MPLRQRPKPLPPPHRSATGRIGSRYAALKATKYTDVRRKTVSFVALSEGPDIDGVKEPMQRLARRNNVGKRYYPRMRLRPEGPPHPPNYFILNSFQHPWPGARQSGQRQLFSHTKTQRHEDVVPTAKRLSTTTAPQAAPLTSKWAYRPKPSSSCLCVFVRNKRKRSAEGKVG